MAKKKIKDKIATSPQKKNSGAKGKGKISKAREAIREEMRAILAAAREKNLIEKTASTVRKARSFTTEDILSFISDVKVKTKEEVKKIIPKRENSQKEVSTNKVAQTQTQIETPPRQTSMSYYDRWYYMVSKKGQ